MEEGLVFQDGEGDTKQRGNLVMVSLMILLLFSVTALLFLDTETNEISIHVAKSLIQGSAVQTGEQADITGSAIADLSTLKKVLSVSAVWAILFSSAILIIKIVAEREKS